ncbi:MAG: hypothetical protein KDE47_28690 [Caldilineaceae bacterium]|nr:hypothetical protein [Caldilineaceae bacterium]
MNRATYISSYLIYNNIDLVAIQAVAGALINRLYLDQPIPYDKFASVVDEAQVLLNVVPTKPVIKMAKAEHVDAFFRDGSLRLGTFSYYNKFDHEEIGDRSEGSFILVGQCPPTTAFVEIGGGFDHYVFCCFCGEADQACLQRFDYDSSFQIVDIEGFATAIQKRLGALSYRFAECVYSRDKVVVGRVERDFDFNRMSARLLDFVNEAKYFVKPDKYSHQSEFRFTWQMPSDVDVPLDFQCPEAVQYCQR